MYIYFRLGEIRLMCIYFRLREIWPVYILQAKRDKAYRDDQQAQEEKLAQEMERINIVKQRDEKMRQQVRECR